MTIEILPKSWETFFPRLQESHRGAVTIRWTQSESEPTVVAENVPLTIIQFQRQTDACSDLLIVEAGEGNARPVQHQIVEPIRVILRKNGESGRYNQLEILAESGKTEITFTPGIDPALLEKTEM